MSRWHDELLVHLLDIAGDGFANDEVGDAVEGPWWACLIQFADEDYQKFPETRGYWGAILVIDDQGFKEYFLIRHDEVEEKWQAMVKDWEEYESSIEE